MDLLAEARLALLLQDAKCGSSSALSAVDAMSLATMGGARALGLGERVGSLEVGKEADLVAFSLADPAAIPAYDPVTATVCALAGGAGRAVLVTIAGVERVRDGRVLDFDAPRAARRVQAAADALAAWRVDQPRH
jgi:5-methylthioadenosine/S-adenosylhomocysteine deaminase